MRDELFAARPEVDGAAAPHQLRADAVPFPFDHPVVDGAKRLDRLLERRCEEERIGPRPVVVGVLVRQQGREPRRALASTRPSGARRSSSAATPAACASARTTSVCETPTRSSPVRIFSSMNRCRRSSRAHQLPTRACCAAGSSSRSGRMPLLHPVGTAAIVSVRDRAPDRARAPPSPRRHQRPHSTRPAASRRVRWPRVSSRGLRPKATSRLSRRPVRKNTAHAASLREALVKIPDHRRDLGVGGGRAIDRVVECGEAFHRLQSPAGSPSQAVRMTPRLQPALAQITRERHRRGRGLRTHAPRRSLRPSAAAPASRRDRTARSRGRTRAGAGRRARASGQTRTHRRRHRAAASTACPAPTAAPARARRRTTPRSSALRARVRSPGAPAAWRRLLRGTPRSSPQHHAVHVHRPVGHRASARPAAAAPCPSV